jgi:acetylornithine deacetylase/succinyl-diaminopimelate desuccinylase-like protein
MITDILKELIKIDTRSSVLNEISAALFIKNICDRFGIENRIIEPVKGKGSIVAHIPGRDKSKEELLLLSHLDTAEFGDLSKWRFDPCEAVEFKGRIFGRGAIDCKGLVSLWLSLLVDIVRNNLQLERGIIFAAAADEESGGKYGMGYLIENDELIRRCKYVIGEGGGFPIKLGKVTYYTCQNTEKGVASFSADRHFMKENEHSEIFVGSILLNILKGLTINGLYNIELFKFLFKQFLLSSAHRRIDVNSLLRNSFCWHNLGQNALAEIRYLPGTNIKAIHRILADEGIDYPYKDISNVPPTYTDICTALYKIISEQTEGTFKNTKVIPYTTPGYSDNRFLRSCGKVVYGYFPLSAEDKLAGIHGYNECISISGLSDSFNLMKNIIIKFCEYS